MMIVGEERDPATRTCTLFAVDLETREIRWSNVKLDQQWWFTIQEVSSAIVVLQAYEESPLPQPAGIYALEASSGMLLWTLPMLEYVAIYEGNLYAIRRSLLRSEYLRIDSINGNILEVLSEDELPLFSQDTSHLLFPSSIDPQHIASGELEALLAPVINTGDIRGSIEEFVQRNILAASVYSRETKDAQSMLDNRLRQDLLIFDRPSRQLLSQEQLQSSASYPVPGSYFLTNDLLIYVKESNELKAIDLSEI